jgi:hypothetical protein
MCVFVLTWIFYPLLALKWLKVVYPSFVMLRFSDMKPAGSSIYTRDQNLKFSVDDALFSDSRAARTRAVNQLARDYGLLAIPVIEDIIRSVPASDEEFRAFCAYVIRKIGDQEHGIDDGDDYFR